VQEEQDEEEDDEMSIQIVKEGMEKPDALAAVHIAPEDVLEWLTSR
jgi:hypothetical protein